jgi:hypothetical protein
LRARSASVLNSERFRRSRAVKHTLRGSAAVAVPALRDALIRQATVPFYSHSPNCRGTPSTLGLMLLQAAERDDAWERH